MFRHVWCPLLVASGLLAGCASTPTATAQAAAPLATAATTPLTDLNLVRKDIPAVLREAHAAPYRTASPAACAALRVELASLDEALGPDLDAPPEQLDAGDKLGKAAGAAVVGAVARTAEGVIPMRGWVRKLSGAEHRQQEIQACTQAGMVRRAFIKGVLAAGACPAAPDGGPTVAARTQD